MVKSTFINLDETKKQRISTALLHEFSTYPFHEAQVARIIKEAKIARGAFYKYFTDLGDAYAYLYRAAMHDVHEHISVRVQAGAMTMQDYERYLADFLNQLVGGKYYEFIKMHLLQNESAMTLVTKSSLAESLKRLKPEQWAAATLSHETIKAILADPVHQKAYLQRYYDILKKLA